MVCQTADEAIDNANRYTTCDAGYCLKYVRTWLEIPSAEPDATSAWNSAIGKHPGDRNPPRAAPTFWTGGSSGHGHIGLSKQGDVNDQMFRGTDMTTTYHISNQQLEWVENHWGLHYAGWAEGFNGVRIPYLDGGGAGESGGSQWDHGKVWTESLYRGHSDSDSVARLCYRLIHHSKMNDAHRPPKQVRNYNEEIEQAVRFWQKNIYGGGSGPTDGLHLSNKQSNTLFGEAYIVTNDIGQSGDVYVEKLHKGQQDSDSVQRLCYRLYWHPDMNPAHRPSKPTISNYNDQIVKAVQFWQKNIGENINGPKDGSSMSNPQTNTLMGDNYTVHNKD
jgi:hypothetical protein